MALLLFAALASASTTQANALTDTPSIKAPLAARSLLLGCAEDDGLQLAVGGRGHILRRRPSGDWKQTQTPTSATLTAAMIVNGKTAFATGHDLLILRSDDAGESWRKVSHEPEEDRPVLDVLFLDQQHGIAVGAYGLLMRSDNGGTDWQIDDLILDNPDTEGLLPGEEPLPPDFHLNDIARAADGTLYLAAEAGLLYRSDNNGGSWLELPSPYHGSFFGVMPLGGNSLLAFGLRGHLYRSDDRGDSWVQLDSHSEDLLMAGLHRDDGIYIAGLGGTLLHSLDGREFARLPTGGRDALTCLLSGNGGLTATSDAGLLDLPVAEAKP